MEHTRLSAISNEGTMTFFFLLLKSRPKSPAVGSLAFLFVLNPFELSNRKL